MKRVMSIFLGLLSSLVFAFLAVIALSEASPIYNFAEPVPFEGPDIFDPYASYDSSAGWKRANLHTHTRVTGILNECPDWPDKVYADYMKFGYDILAFSNHNELTEHPINRDLQIDVYEHGINLFKFHKLVFNPGRMILHDIMLPFLASQRQFELDYLGRNADFVVLNHPDRTDCTTTEMMRKLSGYRFMEVDCGPRTDCRKWDEALSAGHYSYCLANDDCHDSNISDNIAMRCSWWNAQSAGYEDVRKSLLGGCGYAMRIPDFGDGDWEVKYSENAALPRVERIGMYGTDTVSLVLSAPASVIKVWGENHSVLDSICDSRTIEYAVKPHDSYVRLTAEYDNGVVIYTNPFARYDRTKAESPFSDSPHTVNWTLTVLFNLAVLALTAFLMIISVKSASSSCRRSDRCLR